MENKVISSTLMLAMIAPLCAIVNGLCTFPEALRDNWISSDKQTLNFTDNTIEQFPVSVFSNSRKFRMLCMEQRGNVYLLKSDGHFHSLYMFTCYEFEKVSDDLFVYHIATKFDKMDREYIYVNNTADIDHACNRKRPFPTESYQTLIREGAFADGYSGMMCPSDLYHTFSQGTLSSPTAGPCSNNFMDVCGDRRQIKITYGSCAPQLKFTIEGSYVCLKAYTSPSGVTYVHLWNNDTHLNFGINRINCLAFRATEYGVQGTLNPRACHENQTDTKVANPAGVRQGIVLRYDNTTKTCKDVHVVKPSLIGLYAGIGGGVLAFIILTIITIYVIYKTRCRCIKRLYKDRKIGNSEELLSNGGPMSKDDRNNKFVAKKSNHLTPVVIPELYPPDKVELLYHMESQNYKRVFDCKTLVPVSIPKIGPPEKVELLYKVESKSISKRVRFDTSVFVSDLSLKVI